MAQQVIRTEYGSTVVLSNIRKGKSSIPVIGMNDSYTATKVTTWYDGSPMTPEKADGAVYLRYKETGEYFRVNLPNDGELFLEKDTVAQLRAMNAVEILLLKMGYYKGVTLNGYYNANDTPAPIQYYLSDTVEEDDGGSIFEVGEIKLEHEFDIVYPEYFGALGDGNQDDSAFILKMSDYIQRSSTNKLSFLPKVYLIGRYVSPNNVLILMKDDLDIEGNNAILRLKDEVLKDTNYNIKFIFANRNLQNINIRNLTLDFNGVNNFVVGQIMNYSIGIGSVYNITNLYIDSVSFLANPARQTLLIGNNSTNGVAKRVTVDNCKFIDLGNGVVGNDSQTDHSAIFVHGDDITISNNYFENTRDFIQEDLYPTSSAIETHCENITCYGNKIINFKNAFVIAAMTRGQRNAIYSGNICDNIGKFLEIWVRNNMTLDNVVVENNSVHQLYYYSFIDGYTNMQTPADKITIKNNYFEAVNPRSSRYANPCFHLRNWKNIFIQNNHLKRVKSGAGQIIGSADIPINIDIKGNIFEDLGDTDSSAATMNHRGFLFNLGAFESILFENNDFIFSDDVTIYLQNMIDVDNSCKRVIINNNKYLKSNSIRINNTATFEYVYLNHKGIVNPRESGVGLRASIGSELFDTVNNIKWEKVLSNLSGTPWKRVSYATAAPVTGSYLTGDTVYNTIPNSSNKNVGWICISNGSPGTWQAFGGIGINQSAASADTATAPSATYDQAEVQAILTELRDLKTKLRTAGILAT